MFNPAKLKECRDDKRYSVDDLMFALRLMKLKISDQTIRNWESGMTVPNANQLSQIAAFFKKPIKFFFE